MSDPNSKSRKRNLPSWMSSRDAEKDDTIKPKGDSAGLSKLMEGVVFVLSGFVNPERGVLRSQMIEMGAEYQPDWNSNCTLLVCAFANTPKFKQVKADGGTVISKDWISECYGQKKLVDIETYLLHAGKPWRTQSKSHEATKPLQQVEKRSPSKKAASASSKSKGLFSPSKVKKWAVEDFKRTILWLESQDEKPESGEIAKVAAQGILTCLQDAIDSLSQGKGLEHIADQWACLPQLVEELTRLDANGSSTPSSSKDDLCKEAMVCKQIYELEFLNLENDHEFLNKIKSSPSQGSRKVGKRKQKIAGDDNAYDSDATIEMTEEEIDQAYNSVACSL